MIRYVADGRSRERLDHGERKALVLAALASKPWQTRLELGCHVQTLYRLAYAGAICRRKSTRKQKPFEYALAAELANAER